MEPWGRELRGRLDEHVIESDALRGNPLGDPHVRPLWVYAPPGPADDAELPALYLIQGMTGQLDMWRNRSAFRPNVVELASVRLARRHGVDLAAEPGRARALVGANVWELVRPDQPTPAELAGRGWPLRRLEELVLELEEI